MKTTRFDPAAHLTDPEDQATLLQEVIADGSPGELAHALGVIARARGMTTVAKDSGVTREALYRALSEDGDPRLSTLLAVLKALQLELSIKPAAA